MPISVAPAWQASISSFPTRAFASKTGAETAERALEDMKTRVERLEAVEAANTTISRLLTWLDDSKTSPQVMTSEHVANMFTPSAIVDAGKQGSAETLSEVLPLMEKLAKQGGPGSRNFTTNVVAGMGSPVAESLSQDTNIIKATAYSLLVQPVAGAKPCVAAVNLVRATLEKGLDSKWRIKRIVFTESVQETA